MTTKTKDEDTEAEDTEQSIWQIVDEVLEESPADDPHIIAKEVLDRIDDERWRELLFYAVVLCIQARMRTQRSAAYRAAEGGEDREEGESWRKRASSVYAALLATRESVADNEYRPLGECTIEDLKAIIARRHENAKAAMAAVQRYKRLLKALTEAKVQVVAELPEATLLAVMR